MAADGGYAFKYTSEGYDVKDAGIAKDGVKDAMNFVKSLVEKGIIFQTWITQSLNLHLTKARRR